MLHPPSKNHHGAKRAPSHTFQLYYVKKLQKLLLLLLIWPTLEGEGRE